MRVRKADRTAAIQQLDQERKAFASEVTLLKHRAGELGLFYTMQKLDLAVLQVGYELAGTPELGFKKELESKKELKRKKEQKCMYCGHSPYSDEK